MIVETLPLPAPARRRRYSCSRAPRGSPFAAPTLSSVRTPSAVPLEGFASHPLLWAVGKSFLLQPCRSPPCPRRPRSPSRLRCAPRSSGRLFYKWQALHAGLRSGVSLAGVWRAWRRLAARAPVFFARRESFLFKANWTVLFLWGSSFSGIYSFFSPPVGIFFFSPAWRAWATAVCCRRRRRFREGPCQRSLPGRGKRFDQVSPESEVLAR